jgi:threonine/homoserine/homoserine lactone efflux protein
MLGYLLLGITYAFAAAVQPGPLMAYVVSQAVSSGWRHTLPAAFAPLLSDGPIIVLVLLLLSRIPPWFVKFLHFAGAIFLFYLAVGAFRAWRRFEENEATEPRATQRTLLKAAFVNILNPNPYLGWSLVMGPLFLRGYRESPLHGIALLVGFYGMIIVSLAGIIILFACARRLGPRVSRYMLGASVAGLAAFGVYQVWLGVSALR